VAFVALYGVLTVSAMGAPSRTVTVLATAPDQAAPPITSTGGGCGGCRSVPGASLWLLAALLAKRLRRRR